MYAMIIGSDEDLFVVETDDKEEIYENIKHHFNNVEIYKYDDEPEDEESFDMIIINPKDDATAIPCKLIKLNENSYIRASFVKANLPMRFIDIADELDIEDEDMYPLSDITTVDISSVIAALSLKEEILDLIDRIGSLDMLYNCHVSYLKSARKEFQDEEDN